MGLRIIWDDGTPACLPRWARDEIVALRIENANLVSRLPPEERAAELRRAAARARARA
jgi:hypothetical protein